MRDTGQGGALIVLDEVQKVPHWSEAVKRLWDADTRARRPLKVVLLGSAPLLVQRGLAESLAGRVEIVHLPHWTWAEMQEAFDWDVEQYLARTRGVRGPGRLRCRGAEGAWVGGRR